MILFCHQSVKDFGSFEIGNSSMQFAIIHFLLKPSTNALRSDFLETLSFKSMYHTCDLTVPLCHRFARDF